MVLLSNMHNVHAVLLNGWVDDVYTEVNNILLLGFLGESYISINIKHRRSCMSDNGSIRAGIRMNPVRRHSWSGRPHKGKQTLVLGGSGYRGFAGMLRRLM